MSAFECPVVCITIEPHPNADAIEIARVGDFQSIVKKGQFQTGDLAVYLPEASVLPEYLLKRLGMWDDANNVGKLNGSAKNRIKAVKLRGVLSQGMVYPVAANDGIGPIVTKPVTIEKDGVVGEGEECFVATEGRDAAEFLGVTKYEPTIPAQMMGKCLGVNLAITHNYDFENIKKNPSLFEAGEEVVITEKIHGTFMQVVFVPASHADEKFYKGRVVITSKGLGARGIILDHNDEANVYVKAAKKHDLLEKVYQYGQEIDSYAPDHVKELPLALFGEVFGKGVQDLGYDAAELSYRAFDVCSGVREQASFCPFDDFIDICEGFDIPRVPVLYRGPFSKEVLLEHTDGVETVSGKSAHIREGVVVKTACANTDGDELRHPRYGRKVAKSISEAYLLRKNATEFN